MNDDELFTFAKEIKAPIHLVQYVHREGRLPVVNFAAGGIVTPADAALMMQLGVDGVFVGLTFSSFQLRIVGFGLWKGKFF